MKQACFASRNVNPLRKKRHTQVALLTEPVRMNMPFYLRINCGHYIEGLFWKCRIQTQTHLTQSSKLLFLYTEIHVYRSLHSRHMFQMKP